MLIRRFKESDARAVSDLITLTMRISNTRDYPAEQMEELILHQQPSDVLRRAAVTHFYVAEEEGRILGSGAVGPCQDREDICCLYSVFVLPGEQGRGIGKRIMEALEKDDFSLKAERIEVPASITGLPFYLSLGYRYKNGDSALDEDGLYRLEKVR